MIPAPGRCNWKPRLCSMFISKQRGQNNLILTKAVQWCFIAGINKNIVLLLSLFLISILFYAVGNYSLFLKCSLVITKKNSFVC